MDVLFVCLENVCRSPMAQAIAQERWLRRGLGAGPRFASAGVLASMPHAPIDPRARLALERRGYPVPRHRARRWTLADLDRFDLVVAMDTGCLRALEEDSRENVTALPKLSRLLDWSETHRGLDIPDPYFGPSQGFDEVVRLCEIGIDGLFDRAFAHGAGPLQAGGSRW